MPSPAWNPAIKSLMASQKLTNCCVAAIALVTAAYLSTPHSSTIARLAFGAFCLAIPSLTFLRKHQSLMDSQKRITPPKSRKELAGSYWAMVPLKYASSRSVNGVKAL
jgi:hypothetical protein